MENSEALRRIEEAASTKATELDLSHLAMTRVPAEITQLTHLEKLSMSDNRLPSLPEEIGLLTNLTELDVCNNQIKSLPESIGKLRHLRRLILRAIYLDSLPDSFSQLVRLEELDLWRNNFTRFPEQVCELRELKILRLDSNELPELIDKVGALTSLRELTLKDNRLVNLPFLLSKCQALEQLALDKNLLTRLPPCCVQLQKLRVLTVSGNLIARFPIYMGSMRHLELLDASENHLRFVPSGLDRLPSLKELDLSGNLIREADVEGKLTGDRLERITKLASKERPVTVEESRLILVGSGGVGKTTLKNALVRNTCIDADHQTRGIDVDFWPLVNTQDASREPVDVAVWDFGGQVVYHSVHQIYLAQKAIYILVFDTRGGLSHGRLEYWLNAIATFAKLGPVIIVQNTYEDDVEPFDIEWYKRNYPNVKSYFEIRAKPDDKSMCRTMHKSLEECRCSTCEGLLELRARITRDLYDPSNKDLIEIVTWSPAMWQAVGAIEEETSKKECPLMGYEALKKVCTRNGLFAGEVDEFLEHLHKLGRVLFFSEEPKLQGQIVLRPAWAKDAIYRIIDSKVIKKRQGTLHYSDLPGIWGKDSREYERDSYQYLLNLMEHHSLAYQVHHTIAGDSDAKYIIPTFLSTKRVEYVEDKLSNPRTVSTIEYHYPGFFDASIIAKLIVNMNSSIVRHGGRELCWRTGVWLQSRDGDAVSLVECFEAQKRIEVRVAGNDRRELLAVIREEFAGIHSLDGRRSIKVSEKIRCICDECQGGPKSGLFEYKYVKDAFYEGKKVLNCPIAARNHIDIMELLFGVDVETLERRAVERADRDIAVYKYGTAGVIGVVVILALSFRGAYLPAAALLLAALSFAWACGLIPRVDKLRETVVKKALRKTRKRKTKK